MINGVHRLIYSRDPEADRAFLRDILEFDFVDAHDGWLIFGLPPAELAVHPGDGKFVEKLGDHGLLGTVVYFMCDKLHETIASLNAKGAITTEIQQMNWGLSTTVRVPSRGGLGLYEPRHATALHLAKR